MDYHNSPDPEPDNIQPAVTPDNSQSAVIKVFGVGGGGCNALGQLINAGVKDVHFKCINTDSQALKRFAPEHVLELGNDLTKGLGAGADPEVGTAAATESLGEISAAIGDADMLFLAAGMGGGTGTGALPLIASKAREMGVLTVAVVTEPFAFEGERRRAAAADGLEQLRECADSMIVVPNENLLAYLGPNVTLVEAFAAANDVVANAVQSIAELITTSGLINVDFADVRTVMTSMGHAIMSTGRGMGENRAEEAAIGAIKSPLLNNVDLKAAKGILANITSSSDLSMGEFQAVGDIIRQIAADDATVIIGTVFDEQMNHEIKVTVVATGLKPPKHEPTVRDNDDLAAKLTQPTLTASEKAAAEAATEADTIAASEAAETQAAAQAAAEMAQAEAAQAEAKAVAAQAEAKAAVAEQARLEARAAENAVLKAEADALASVHQLKTSNSKTTPEGMPKIPATKIESSSELEINKVCIICGCVNGKHLAKCPWSNNDAVAKPQVPKTNADVDVDVDVDLDDALEEPVIIKAPTARGFGSGKKIGFGIVAAGLVAAAAWFALNHQKAEDSTLVEEPPAETEKPGKYIGDLRSIQPYSIPTLELNNDQIKAAEEVGDNLIPNTNDKRPNLEDPTPTEVSTLSDE